MNHIPRIATALLFAAGLAGCGIGEGSTVETLEIIPLPAGTLEQGVLVDRDLPTERFHMYDCFCANIAALAVFTDESLADFSNRVTFTSSDETIVEVLNFEETDTDACPLAQNAAGMVIPRGTGTAVVTATFGPLSAQMTVEVADASAGTYVLVAAPPADPGNTDVAVGAQLPLSVTGTLDDRTRILSGNVLAWAVDGDPDADFASVDANGIVRGIAATGASPKAARASFGTCTDVSPTALVNVGEILGPLTLEREAPDFAFDDLLANGTDEELVVTAPLDFDGDAGADGEQLLSQQIGLTYTGDCTLREFDATVPTTSCRETATTCDQDVPLCSADTALSCVSGMEACRTVRSPILPGSTVPNQIISFTDSSTPTSLTATFPRQRGVATTLVAAIDGVATTLEVAELSDYPITFPWFGVIDASGAREDVRVTGADGTTLTVVRGVGGTVAAAHAAGASFEARTASSAPTLDITAREGTLTTVAIDPPATLAPLGTLQLRAEGTFVDEASASRQQRITRLVALLAAQPTLVWTSSATAVATVGATDGLMTSVTACGGRATIRARATTSTDETTQDFDPDSTADDDACLATDPLCDQVEVCIATASPLPLGTTCETPTTCP